MISAEIKIVSSFQVLGRLGLCDSVDLYIFFKIKLQFTLAVVYEGIG